MQGYDVGVRPGLERAEEIGQIVGSPLLQSLIEGQPGAGAVPRYLEGGRAYMDALRAQDGGLDVRGATKAFTDAGDYSPGVVGASGILADPLNLLPFGKAGRAPGFIDDLLRMGRSGDLGAILRQLGEAGRGYPGAMVDEVRDVERFFGGLGGRLKSAGRTLLKGADAAPAQAGQAPAPTLSETAPVQQPPGTAQQPPLMVQPAEPQTTNVRSVPGRA